MRNVVRLCAVTITFTALVALASCRRHAAPVTSPGEAGNYIHVGENDAEMNAAIQRARSELGTFIDQLTHPRPGQEFAIKAALPADNGGEEHIWISGLSYSNGIFQGRLGNDPMEMKALKLGSPVSVSQDRVSDWTITEGGKVLGDYTAPILEKRGG